KAPENKKSCLVHDDGKDIPADVGADEFSGEQNLIRQEEEAAADEMLKAVLELFEDDDEASLVLVGVMDGLAVAEICDQVGISKTRYESIRTSIRRKIKIKFPK